MTRSSAAGYRQVLDLTVRVLDESGAVGEARTDIAETLAGVLHGDVAVIQTTDLIARRRPSVTVTEVKASSHAWMRQSTIEPLYDRYTAVHPLAVHFALTRDAVPRTVDEIVDRRTWLKNPVYLAAKAALGIDRHLAIPLAAPTGTFKTLAIGRSGRDFCTRDRETARELQPLLNSFERHLAELGRHPTAGQDDSVTQFGLTPRERIVVALLGEGLSNAAIARRLGISLHTVTKHQENIYRKMGTHDRLTTVLLAQQARILGTETG